MEHALVPDGSAELHIAALRAMLELSQLEPEQLLLDESQLEPLQELEEVLDSLDADDVEVDEPQSLPLQPEFMVEVEDESQLEPLQSELFEDEPQSLLEHEEPWVVLVAAAVEVEL